MHGMVLRACCSDRYVLLQQLRAQIDFVRWNQFEPDLFKDFLSIHESEHLIGTLIAQRRSPE